jgi:radical SAM superfamily enzyme YgiQ (UPF0313 family)
MNKTANIERKIEILKEAKEVGINNMIFLMIGYLYETEDDLKQTALLLKDNSDIIDFVRIFSFFLPYGSYLLNNPKENKIKLKESQSFFFSYIYDYEEAARKYSKKDKERLSSLRENVKAYASRHSLSKDSPFPFNIMLKFLPLRFYKTDFYPVRKRGFVYFLRGFVQKHINLHRIFAKKF